MPDIEITTVDSVEQTNDTDKLIAIRAATDDDPQKLIQVAAEDVGGIPGIKERLIEEETKSASLDTRITTVENRGAANLGAAAQQFVDGLNAIHDAGEITYTNGIISAVDGDLTDLTLTGDTDGITLQAETVSGGRRIWLRGLAGNINKVIALTVASVPSGNVGDVHILYIQIPAHGNIQHHLISIDTDGHYQFADPAAADTATLSSGSGTTTAEVGDTLIFAPSAYSTSGVSFTVQIVRSNGTVIEENTVTFNTANSEGVTPLEALDLSALLFDIVGNDTAKHLSKVTVLQRGIGGYISHSALTRFTAGTAFLGSRIEGVGSDVIEQTKKIKMSGGIEDSDGLTVEGLQR